MIGLSYGKKRYADEADKMANALGLSQSSTSVHNGRVDAFRHTYTCAVIARDYGQWAAEKGGNLVENTGGNSEAERWMDERNNAIGREIGREAFKTKWSDNEVAAEVKRQMDRRIIVVTPYDPRRTYEVHGDWQRAVNESEAEIKKDKLAARHDPTGAKGTDADFDAWEYDRKWVIQQQEKRRKEKELDKRDAERAKGQSSLDGVFVHAYSRRTGEVRSHRRSTADGDVGNNWS